MTTTPQPVESLKPLTSLRFVAAMMIVCFHARDYFKWAWLSHIPDAFATGVSFFFVLSGFILTHVYTSKGFPGYPAFLRARFARLWPVHVFALILLVAFVNADSMTYDGPGLFSKWITLATNLTLTQALIPYTAFGFCWNSVSWSISTEAAFYLAFPLLLINVRRSWHWKFIASLILAYAFIFGMKMLSLPYDGDIHTISMHSVTATNPLFRGMEFCLGIATWAIWDRYIKNWKLASWAWSTLEIIVVLFVALWITMMFDPLQNAIAPSIARLLFDFHASCLQYAALIAVLAMGRGFIGQLLSRRTLVFLGEVSFSIYMLHQILMKVLTERFPEGAISPLIYFTALLLIAMASYVFIEVPSQRFLIGKRKIAREPRLPVDNNGKPPVQNAQ